MLNRLRSNHSSRTFSSGRNAADRDRLVPEIRAEVISSAQAAPRRVRRRLGSSEADR